MADQAKNVSFGEGIMQGKHVEMLINASSIVIAFDRLERIHLATDNMFERSSTKFCIGKLRT